MSRFHLTLFSGGRPVQHDWWTEEATARDKFRDWIGSCTKMPDPRVTLTEEVGGAEQLLDSWPDSPSGQASSD